MNRQKPEDVVGAARPFTGKEYLESLRDGREIWIYGERVTDVTTHPGFRNTARMIARLYDALHDPARKDVLTIDNDRGGFTHRFYKGDESLGQQAQRAGEHARELPKKDGGSGGFFAQARKEIAAQKEQAGQSGRPAGQNKRVTPPKNAPTNASGRVARPASSGKAARNDRKK